MNGYAMDSRTREAALVCGRTALSIVPDIVRLIRQTISESWPKVILTRCDPTADSLETKTLRFLLLQSNLSPPTSMHCNFLR